MSNSKAFDQLYVTSLGLGDGIYSLTLPEWASVFLSELELIFGPRDPSFTFVGIDIDQNPGSFPRLWYPNSGVPPKDTEGRSRHVIVRLGSGALTDVYRARWQLAHECLHLLDPWNQRLDGRPTNCLEEGLASWYQNYRVPEAASREGSYAVAESLVAPLMDSLPSVVKHIRREQNLRIGEITPDALCEYRLDASRDVLQRLCQPFHYD